MVGAFCGSFIIDRVGRRKLFIFSTSCAALIMLIVGCLLSPAGVPEGQEMNQMRANAAVTFIRKSTPPTPAILLACSLYCRMMLTL